LIRHSIRPSALLAALLFAFAGPGAHAESKIYRCGQTYQQVPCEQGQAIDASDQRTGAQRRDARDAAKSEQQQAKDLAAERRQREKAVTPQREVVRTGVAPKPAPAAASAALAAPPGHPKKKGGKGGKTKPEIDDPMYLAPPAVNGK
jgi:hypothetical protein